MVGYLTSNTLLLIGGSYKTSVVQLGAAHKTRVKKEHLGYRYYYKRRFFLLIRGFLTYEKWNYRFMLERF